MMDHPDFIINDHIIPWRKAVDRVVFYCPTEKLDENENLVKKHLSAWATENIVTLVDIETVIDYFKPIFTALNNLPACHDCPRYTGPSIEEIRKSYAFNEIENEALRWLLSDYFYWPTFEDKEDNECANHYGRYIFYYSASLLKDAADPNNRKSFNNRLSRLHISTHYWRRSRRPYCCAAFAVCSEELLNSTRYWDGIDIIGRVPPISIINFEDGTEVSSYNYFTDKMHPIYPPNNPEKNHSSEPGPEKPLNRSRFNWFYKMFLS